MCVKALRLMPQRLFYLACAKALRPVLAAAPFSALQQTGAEQSRYCATPQKEFADLPQKEQIIVARVSSDPRVASLIDGSIVIYFIGIAAGTS